MRPKGPIATAIEQILLEAARQRIPWRRRLLDFLRRLNGRRRSSKEP